jgi:hypothetical protein
MEIGLIDVHLTVEIKNGKVIAQLSFCNRSEKKVYLNKQTMYYNGEVRNDYLEITGDDDVKSDYLGIMANCTRQPDEFVLLEPGEKINASIPLNEFYNLAKGKKYAIQYNAFNPSYLKEQQMIEMQSNIVEVIY